MLFLFSIVMVEIKCFIFDDEPASIVQVSFLLGKYAPHWKIIGVASDVSKCRKLLEEQQADVIFTDIHFGEDDVFKVLPELKAFKGDIIFISGDNGFAAQAFELSAVNYFLKPINEDLFKSFIDKYIAKPEQIENKSIAEFLFQNLSENKNALKKIAFNTVSGYVIKEINDIIYAKASSNYTELSFLNKEKILASKTLLVFEKMLEGYGFFRVHQSYLVNFKYVVKFDSENLQIELSNGEKIPVSNRKRSELLELLKNVF